MNSVSQRSGRFPSFQQWSPLGALAGGIFIIDLLTPLGVAAGVLYIAVVLLSLRHQNAQLPLWTAVVCSILTLIALFISPIGGEFWKVLSNRGLALFAIWTTTLMGRIQLQQTGTIQQNLLLTDRVFMASNDHISILGRDYRYHRVNPSYVKNHGRSSQEVVGMDVSELLGKEIFEATVKPKLDQCFQGKEVHYEAWFRFADDQDHYMAVSYLPLASEDKNIEEIVVIARDWTERKHMEETVQTNQQQLRTILDAMTNFVGIGTADGIVTDCNQAPLDMAGLTREDVIGKSFIDTYWLNYSPKVQEQVRGIIQRVSQGKIIREDIQARMSENLFITVDACYVPVKDRNGHIVQIVHSGIDVTERRQAEDALRKSEDQFRDLYESAPLAYFSVSFDGHITRVNGRASELLGYSQKELIGKHVLALYAPTQEGREKASTLQKKTQKGISIYDEELEMVRKDGTLLWVTLTVRLIFDESGNVIERRGMVQNISDRKRIESELQASEYRFRSLVETAGSIIIGLTPDGWIVEWNREAERLYGKSRKEVLDKNYFETFILESDRLHIAADIQKVLAGTPSRNFENIILDGDGERHQILWNMDRLLDENQQPYGIICIGREITEWKAAQTQLQKWATIYQHTQWGVAVGDSDSQFFEFVNEAYAQMHGYTIEELEGQPIRNLFAPEFRNQLPGIIQVIKEKELHSFEAPRKRKDGTTFPALITISAIKDTDGTMLYGVSNVIDITTLKHAEEALKKSEERFRTYFETGLVGMAITSLEKGWLEANDQLCTILGYPREELKKKTWAELTYPDDLPHDETEFEKLLAGTHNSYSMEKRFIRKDGTVIFTNLYVNAVRTPSKHVEYVTAMIQDITERKALESVIQKHNEDLEMTVAQRTSRIQELEQRRMQVEKLAALSQIAAGVAHEINNPLASISQSLVLLKRSISKDHPHHRYMGKTEDCIQRIATITKNLYQLYRPSGPIPMPVDIRICIQTAMDIMEERAGKHGMRITVPSFSKPILTKSSQGELIQVLCNLLHNAIDASPRGGTIEISLTTESEALTLVVADQGEGIPPETAPHIFEPFFTTKQDRTEGGMGLGLSISHSLVESMGGTLDFSTAIGHGSTFTITLPLTSP